ncbi:MAG: ABC transporter ATP-binding protein [Alphaproteobacteria bacterium]
MTESAQYALEIEGLTKRFDRLAVDGLSLRIRAGEFYALLGPNGAGKTTTLRIVAGLLHPDAGSVRVCGIDIAREPTAAKQRMAWVSDEPILYDKLTPFEYLEFIAALWGMEPALAERRARELLDLLGLTPHIHERCEGFSKGMRQKVTLAGALVHDPQLIILDEPLTGLDAGAARDVKQVLTQRVRAGATIVMTTHILEVAERMAERIGIIHHGKLLTEGTLATLRRQAGREGGTLEEVFLSLVAATDSAA